MRKQVFAAVLSATAVVSWCMVFAGPVAAAPVPHAPAAPYDFDGDGYPELLIGQYEDLGGFWVMPGSASGPSTTQATHWTRESPGITGAGRGMSSAYASGDFDRDGYADVAASHSYEPSPRGASMAGNVQVLYGSASGLTGDRDQWWTQDSPGIADTSEAYDQFGEQLAAGDLNGDGYDDLVIGVPKESIELPVPKYMAGAVHVLFGSSTGLTAMGSQFWTEDTGGVPGIAVPSGYFGLVLEIADVTSDGIGDLVLGTPEQTVDGVSKAGAVLVLPGSAAGPTAQGAQQWTASLVGLTTAAKARFGGDVVAGDFGGTPDLELAIGITGRKVTPISLFPEGSLVVLTGTPTGLTATGRQLWTQSSPGIADDPEPFDAFGGRLAAGDLDGDGHDDLAIVANDEAGPWPEDDAPERRGVVHVLYGSAAGLSATGSQFWHQDVPGVDGQAEQEDLFGAQLQILDWDVDGRADLAAGSTYDFVGPRAHEPSTRWAGSANLLFGTILGVTTARQQHWYQGAYAIPGPYEEGDSFGVLGS